MNFRDKCNNKASGVSSVDTAGGFTVGGSVDLLINRIGNYAIRKVTGRWTQNPLLGISTQESYRVVKL